MLSTPFIHRAVSDYSWDLGKMKTYVITSSSKYEIYGIRSISALRKVYSIQETEPTNKILWGIVQLAFNKTPFTHHLKPV